MMTITGVFKIKGIGYVISGHVKQWNANPDNSPQQVIFYPSKSKGIIKPPDMIGRPIPIEITDCNFGFEFTPTDINNIPQIGDIMEMDS